MHIVDATRKGEVFISLGVWHTLKAHSVPFRILRYVNDIVNTSLVFAYSEGSFNLLSYHLGSLLVMMLPASLS